MAKMNERHASFLRQGKAHSTFPGEVMLAKTWKTCNEWLKEGLKITQ